VNPANRLAALGRVEMLKDLAKPDLEAVAALCRWRGYEKDQQVVEQDGVSNDVYFVARGRVRITIYAINGREVTFRDLGAGASFGELSAVDGRSRSASVVALEDTWLASLSRDQFRKVLRSYPAVVDNVLNGLVGLIRNLTERVVEYSTLGVRNRIQAELVRMARERGITDNRAILNPPPKHADIAARVSTNREEVTREFGHLTREKVVEKRDGELVIVDVARLIDMVDKVRER